MDPSKSSFESRGGVDRHDRLGLRQGEEYVIRTYLRGRVLDLGCGTGRTTAHLAERGDVVGVDYSRAMIERAKRNHPTLDFRVMDARSLAFPDKSFDAALFSFNGLDFLYPLTDRARALREIRRVLAPGGVFAYASHTGGFPPPNTMKRILGHLYRLVRGYRPPYFTHYTGYGFVITCHLERERHIEMLKEAGLELIESFPLKPGEEMFIAKAV